VNRYKKLFIASLAGTIATAVCCFTPILVIALVSAGLSMIVPYLDFILFPALGLLLIINILSFVKWKMLA
jgi:mercuric ion transport protein